MDDGNNSGSSPKTGIFDNAKKSYTPDFRDDKKEQDENSKAADEKNSFFGRNALKAGENAASEDPNSDGRGGDTESSLGEKESNVTSDNASKISNAVKGIQAARSGRYVTALKNAKKSGPILGIIVGIFMFAGMAYMGNSLAPFSLVSVFQNGDPLTISSQRNDNIMRRILAPSSRKQSVTIDGKIYDINNLTKAKLFSKSKFKLSSYQKTQLKRNGFSIEKVGGVTVLKKGGTTIIPDSKYANKLKIDGDVIDYKTAMGGNNDLSLSLKQGSMTFRSRVRYWFDTKIKGLFSRIGLSRNRTNDFKNGDADEVKQHAAKDSKDNDLADGKITNETVKEEVDAGKGKTTIETTTNEGDSLDLSGIKKGASDQEIETKLKSAADAKTGSVFKGAVSKLAMMACTASNIVGSVMNVMRALNLMQVRKTALQIFEIIQKGQIGENVGNALNAAASIIMTPKEDSYRDKNGTVTEKGTVFDASSVKSQYEGKPRDPDISTNALNPFASLGELAPILKGFGLSVTSFATCASIQIATSLTSLGEQVNDVLSVIACFSPAAVVGCADLAWAIGSKIAASVTIQMVVNALVSWMVPKVASWLITDVTKSLGGILGGNVIGFGIKDILNKNAQTSSSSLATPSTYTMFKNDERIAINENASYERATRSPFDPTSQYTFLGSLVSKMATITPSTPLASLVSLGSTALSSISSLMPHAAAISDAEMAQYLKNYTHKYCANLDSIGALAGDAFCNPVMIEDVSTIDIDPAEVIAKLDKDPTLNCFEDQEGDNPTIRQDSTCMKFIVNYTQRESEFGVADMNIANNFSLTGDNVAASTAVNATPVIGELTDILNNSKALANLGYVTGEVGVTKNDGKGLSVGDDTGSWIVPTWNQAKYIQRYISDQRILEGMGLIEESAVTAALRTYYEEHPLDNSFEGILARKTGMTKENVEVALDFMKLASFTENYEPEDYAPYAAKKTEKEAISFNDDSINPIDNYKNTGAHIYIVRRDYSIAG